jgi:hypothetical protein
MKKIRFENLEFKTQDDLSTFYAAAKRISESSSHVVATQYDDGLATIAYTDIELNPYLVIHLMLNEGGQK